MIETASPDAPRHDLVTVLQQVARGDTGAFALLYDALVPSVRDLAHMTLGGRAGVAEAVRTTFVELWTRAPDPNLTNGLPLDAWVLSRVHHHALALRAPNP